MYLTVLNTYLALFAMVRKYLQCRNVIKILRMVQWNFDGCCDWQADIAGTSQKQSLEYLLINATLILLLNCLLKFKAIHKLPLVHVMDLELQSVEKQQDTNVTNVLQIIAFDHNSVCTTMSGRVNLPSFSLLPRMYA